jgi:hypothetical protein
MNTTKCLTLLGGIALVGVLVGSGRDASAQAKRRESEVATIGTITITARPTRPSAVVELGKILPEIEISSVRQPFLKKIEDALMSEPF